MKRLTPELSAVLLAGVAAYVDTLGFIALFGLFTAHVTGNFVLIGSELVKSSHGVWLKLLVFPAFVLAVAATRLFSLALALRKWSVAKGLLGLEAVLLLAFMLAGWRLAPLESPDSLAAMLTGILGAAAMGVQNGAGRLVLAKLAPTTVMTGNVTQLVIDLVDRWRGVADEAVRQRIPKLAWPVAAFAVGAIAGAWAYFGAGFLALALPVVLVAGVACWAELEA